MVEDTKKPLSGKCIVITRARSQASELAGRIEALGGEVIEFPTIEIKPADDYGPLDRAIGELESYDWLFLTSVNGVDHFIARLGHCGRKMEEMSHMKVVAIGPETGKTLESAGIHPYFVPTRYIAEGLLEGLRPEEMRGKRVLIARAAQARQILPATLQQWGAKVDVVPVYQTVIPKQDSAMLRQLLSAGKIAAITFTSSSTASHFAELFSGETLMDLLSGVAIVCIGPITARTVQDLGLRVDVVAEEYTTSGLVRSLGEFFSRRGAGAATERLANS
jgi:uroporphyrinogen III methyltransferase/synthase